MNMGSTLESPRNTISIHEQPLSRVFQDNHATFGAILFCIYYIHDFWGGQRSFFSVFVFNAGLGLDFPCIYFSP